MTDPLATIEPAALEGGCFCGAVRYRASGPILSHVICHCRSCRRASGALQVSWFTVPRADFVFLAGEPCRRESSPGVWRMHCPDCGTTLTYEAHAEQDASAPGSIDVTTASLDEPGALAPDAHIWTDDDAPWMRDAHRLPHFRQWRNLGNLQVPGGLPEGLELALVPWHEERARLLAVRTVVFVQEQGVPASIEEDERDPLCLHLLALRAGEPVGAARLDIGLRGKLGRVAVLRAERGHGIGTALTLALQSLASGAALEEVWCHAQLSAVPFYERLGYHAEGEVFEEAGIDHLTLRRSLR